MNLRRHRGFYYTITNLKEYNSDTSNTNKSREIRHMKKHNLFGSDNIHKKDILNPAQKEDSQISSTLRTTILNLFNQQQTPKKTSLLKNTKYTLEITNTKIYQYMHCVCAGLCNLFGTERVLTLTVLNTSVVDRETARNFLSAPRGLGRVERQVDRKPVGAAALHLGAIIGGLVAVLVIILICSYCAHKIKSFRRWLRSVNEEGTCGNLVTALQGTYRSIECVPRCFNKQVSLSAQNSVEPAPSSSAQQMIITKQPSIEYSMENEIDSAFAEYLGSAATAGKTDALPGFVPESLQDTSNSSSDQSCIMSPLDVAEVAVEKLTVQRFPEELAQQSSEPLDSTTEVTEEEGRKLEERNESSDSSIQRRVSFVLGKSTTLNTEDEQKRKKSTPAEIARVSGTRQHITRAQSDRMVISKRPAVHLKEGQIRSLESTATYQELHASQQPLFRPAQQYYDLCQPTSIDKTQLTAIERLQANYHVTTTADVHGFPQKSKQPPLSPRRPVSPRLAEIKKSSAHIDQDDIDFGSKENNVAKRDWSSLEGAKMGKALPKPTRRVKSYEEKLLTGQSENDPLRITEFLNGPSNELDEYERMLVMGETLQNNTNIKVPICNPLTSIENDRNALAKRDEIRNFASNDVRKIEFNKNLDNLTQDQCARQFNTRFNQPKMAEGLSLALDDNICQYNYSTSGNSDRMPTTPELQMRRQKFGIAFSNRESRYVGQEAQPSNTNQKTENSFDSVATDVDRSSSSYNNEVATTSIESTTTNASTESTSDSSKMHKLQQMRGEDSGYKSLETQQSLGKIVVNQGTEAIQPSKKCGISIDIPGIAQRRILKETPSASSLPSRARILQSEELGPASRSLDAHGSLSKVTFDCRVTQAGKDLSHADECKTDEKADSFKLFSNLGQAVVKSLPKFNRKGPTSINSSISSACGSVNHSLDTPTPATVPSSGYHSFDTPPFFVRTKFTFKVAGLRDDNIKGEPTTVQGEQEEFALRKAVSQDLSVTDDKFPAVGRNLARSLDRIKHHAGQYITGAVTQAESILSRVLEQSSGSGEHSTNDQGSQEPQSSSVKRDSIDGNEAIELCEGKSGKYSRDNFVSEEDKMAFQPFRRRADSKTQETKPIELEQKLTVEPIKKCGIRSFSEEKSEKENQYNPQPVTRKIITDLQRRSNKDIESEFLRGNTKTASKKRREYRSRRKHGDVDDSSSPLTPEPSGKASASSSEDSKPSSKEADDLAPISQYLSTSKHPLKRFQQKTFDTAELGHQGRKTQETAGPVQTLGGCVVSRYDEVFEDPIQWKSNPAGVPHHISDSISRTLADAEHRLLRKQTDSILELRRGSRAASGSSALGRRSFSVDIENRRTGGRARYVFTTDSIEEEMEPSGPVS